MLTHFEMLLAVQRHLLETVRTHPTLRPSYHTAMYYWSVPETLKMAYRPTKKSSVPILLKTALQTASPEVKQILEEIKTLGDSFIPFEA